MGSVTKSWQACHIFHGMVATAQFTIWHLSSQNHISVTSTLTMPLQKSSTIIRISMGLIFLTAMYSCLSLILTQLLKPTRLAHVMHVPHISTNSSWILRTRSSLAILIVLQEFYTFQTTGHPLLLYSSHQKYSMVIPLDILCHPGKLLHSNVGCAICLTGPVIRCQNLIFPSTHSK